MAANPSIRPNSYAAPELVPFVREDFLLAQERDGPQVSGAETLKLARGFLEAIDFEVTAIDFEVAAALCLSGSRQAQHEGEVYLVRTLERIAEHMKSLQAIQTSLNQPPGGICHPAVYVINRAK